MGKANTMAMQAAAVTQLLIRNPELSGLPIDWYLRDNGRVEADLALDAPSTLVPAIALELAKAMPRATHQASEERALTDGRRYRAYTVRGKCAGVQVWFDRLELLDGDAVETGEVTG